MSESEPFDEAPRMAYILSKARCRRIWWWTWRLPVYWPCDRRCIEGMTFIWAYLWNAGSPVLMLKGKFKL